MKQEQVMKKRKGEKPLVMMMKVATARVIVVVIAAVVTMEIMRMIATVIVKAAVVKTMIANIVAMIGVNPHSDKEEEDVRPFYEDHFDDDVDYYDGDIKDDAKAKPVGMENGAESEENELENVLGVLGDEVEVEDEEADDIDYDDYPYGWPSNWSCITNVSSRSGPRYDKHGREILELVSFHNSELGSIH